jgi:hypothetical protein
MKLVWCDQKASIYEITKDGRYKRKWRGTGNIWRDRDFIKRLHQARRRRP